MAAEREGGSRERRWQQKGRVAAEKEGGSRKGGGQQRKKVAAEEGGSRERGWQQKGRGAAEREGGSREGGGQQRERVAAEGEDGSREEGEQKLLVPEVVDVGENGVEEHEVVPAEVPDALQLVVPRHRSPDHSAWVVWGGVA